MPTITPIAYNNTGNPIPGTTQFGDLAIGDTAQDYGSFPSGFRFWATPDQDLGYVIAKSVPSGNQPNQLSVPAYVGFNRSQDLTESSFVELSNAITGNNFTTGLDAKDWLETNGYWTSYFPLVTLGLTLQLEASNSSSYPGSGNIWYDLTSPQQNITLIDTPTYTAGTPSYFTFNGTSEYGTGSGAVLSSTSYTKSLWFNLNSYLDNNLISSNSGGHFMFFSTGTNRLYSGHSDWPVYSAYGSNATFNLNTWYYAALTFNTMEGMKLYINGTLDSTYTIRKTALPGDGSTNIACFSPGGNLFNGRISKVYCYNRSLTGAEVLQNYNVSKGHFGL
jgi:hypothetical protein